MAAVRRFRGLAGWLIAGLLIGIFLATLAVLGLTQTRWGQARVLAFTLSAAAERLDGTLEVDRLRGNLLTGARLYGVALRGLDGEPFLLADSAFVEYSLRTLVGAELVIDQLVLYDPELTLRRLPGERFWNYQKILRDTVAVEEEAPEDRNPIIFQRASVSSGFVLVEMPWEPDPELSPAEQAQETREALADTSQILVREVPGGYLRTMRFANVTGALSRIVSAPDHMGGTYVRVDRLAAEAQVFRQPVLIQELRGELALRDGLIEFTAPHVRLPESRLSLSGVLDTRPEDEVRVDVTLRADTVALRDLQWLHPPLPDEGGGQVLLTIQTRPDGTLYLARELRLSAPGTRLSGQFGLIMNDAMRFVEVDLEASPLDIDTVDRILPVDVPVVGLRIGGVEIRGPTT